MHITRELVPNVVEHAGQCVSQTDGSRRNVGNANVLAIRVRPAARRALKGVQS
jgi:hypothetical protein